MLLVHGGGGHAFEQWARLWADRGYVALAMDLSGRGPDRKRLPDGGPEQDDQTKFRDFDPADPTPMWTYHAVAAVLRGHSLLASRPEVDTSRIGVTGISWGGYLTCIVAGVDDRIKVAVPVYGCGFLHEDSFWKPERFDKVPPDRRDRWVNAFDPSKYLPGVTCPILFVNGTNDFAYPLDSYRRSYQAVPGFETLDNPDRLCVTLRMPHGHEAGWAPKEIGLFVDGVLKGGEPLAKLGPPKVAGDKIVSRLIAKLPIEKASILYAVDSGPWPKREWKETAALVVGESVEANLPADRPLVVFLNVVDRRGAVASSPQVLVPRVP
jgi:dienelactone hydrolase